MTIVHYHHGQAVLRRVKIARMICTTLADAGGHMFRLSELSPGV